jgi:hypothetical protein
MSSTDRTFMDISVIDIVTEGNVCCQGQFRNEV